MLADDCPDCGGLGWGVVLGRAVRCTHAACESRSPAPDPAGSWAHHLGIECEPNGAITGWHCPACSRRFDDPAARPVLVCEVSRAARFTAGADGSPAPRLDPMGIDLQRPRVVAVRLVCECGRTVAVPSGIEIGGRW